MILSVIVAALSLLAQAPDYVGQAVQALDAQQPAAAEGLLRKAVAAEADDYTAHFHLALALSLQGKDDEGIAEYRKTLELKPALFEAELNLGILLLRNKRGGEAVPVLREATSARPQDAKASQFLAQALLESDDAAGAEQEYRRLRQLDPTNTAAPTGLARAFLTQGKLPEASEAYRSASDKQGLLEVAAAMEKASRTSEAMAIYQQFPDDPAVRGRLGRLQLDSKNAEAAVGSLEEVVKKSPTTQNRLALADAYRLAGQPAKVLEQLQAAASADPSSFELRMALGRHLRDDRKLMPAAAQFQAATKIQSDSVAAWNELASVLIVNQNYPEGLAALDHVRALSKELPGHYFMRAISLDRLKIKPEAVAAYKAFLEADKGALPDQEFQARQRIRIIELELKKK